MLNFRILPVQAYPHLQPLNRQELVNNSGVVEGRKGPVSDGHKAVWEQLDGKAIKVAVDDAHTGAGMGHQAKYLHGETLMAL